MSQRKVVFYGAISLDGFLADYGYGLDWLMDIPAEDILNDSLTSFMKTVDTTVMGRQTFEDVLKSAGEIPYKEQTNYVFTSNPIPCVLDVNYVQEDLVTFIKKLKQENGKNIWIVGGGKLLYSLIQEHLIDEWYIQFAPILLGKGIPLFGDKDTVTKLELIDSKKYQHFIEIRYRTAE